MKLNKLILPALTALTCFSTHTARAQLAPPVLQFTEKSDTELTVTLDGASFGTVQNLGQDHWQWHSDGLGLTDFSGILPLQWKEPEDPALVNTVNFGLFSGQELGADILSDDSNLLSGAFNDGEQTGPVTLPGLFAFVVFTDLGDQGTTVPDSGSTGVLFLGASLALFGLSRLRSLHSAEPQISRVFNETR